MRGARGPIPAAILVTLWVVAGAGAQASDSGRANDVGASAHPSARWTQNDRFHATMDQVFGPGRWRETSGYRSPSEENRLRLQGAGTVAPGDLSAHSRGTPDAPGAYDAVVYGMSLTRAASMLRASGTEFAQAFAEGAHGPEGAHLHINVGNGLAAVAEQAPGRVASMTARVPCDSIYMRVVGGRRNPLLSSCSNSPG
jgi:hypothetical protein